MALSDTNGILASPLTIIERRDERQAVEAIVSLADQHQVGQIIAGLPRSMDGGIGSQAEKVMGFVQELRSHTDVPVEFRDERLTTVTARSLMSAAHPRKSRRKTRDDAIAAALILQGYLDEKRQGFDDSFT